MYLKKKRIREVQVSADHSEMGTDVEWHSAGQSPATTGLQRKCQSGLPLLSGPCLAVWRQSVLGDGQRITGLKCSIWDLLLWSQKRRSGWDLCDELAWLSPAQPMALQKSPV